jgi:hypothetical protein
MMQGEIAVGKNDVLRKEALVGHWPPAHQNKLTLAITITKIHYRAPHPT